MSKLNKSNCGNTQQLNSCQNSKSQMATKLKNLSCDKTSNIFFFTKWRKSNCEKTQKIKLWQNFFLNQIRTKLKNPNCEKKPKNSDCDKINKLKLWGKKFKNSDGDKTQEL